jgi:hypothetical protein
VFEVFEIVTERRNAMNCGEIHKGGTETANEISKLGESQ